MTRPARKLGPATEAMSSETYRVQAMVEGLDQVAIAMERKWGVDRLRLIVSDSLRAKFDEQKDRLDAAIQSGEERYVAAQVEGMKRAWSALDRAAHDAGEQAARTRSLGMRAALDRRGRVARANRGRGPPRRPRVRVFTTAEVAILIDALGDGVLDIKHKFPGATVTGVRRKAPVDWERGDDIPF